MAAVGRQLRGDEACAIRVILRKPSHWNWKLSTSASSPEVRSPPVLLLDERGKVLADTRRSSRSSSSDDRKDRARHGTLELEVGVSSRRVKVSPLARKVSDVSPASDSCDSSPSAPDAGAAMGAGASRGRRRALSSRTLPRTLARAARLWGSLPNHLDDDLRLRRGYAFKRRPSEVDPALVGHPCPYITTEPTTEVRLVKGRQGLGLSVTGGVDSQQPWPGLIRVKRLFPHQPAWQSGCLHPGDVLLAANGVSLVGLTDCEAIEVLRKAPNNVTLCVCYPPAPMLTTVPSAEPPPIPQRGTQSQVFAEEFDIVLTKVNGTLGFTLFKEDENIMGHYVKSLVREPALSDGGIHPGDKILAVNDVDISSLSHEETVAYLRQCGDSVKLKLCRDKSKNPASLYSQKDDQNASKPKRPLRKEAIDLLSDLAMNKLTSPRNSNCSSLGRLKKSHDAQYSSTCFSPWKKRLTRYSSSDTHSFHESERYTGDQQSLESDFPAKMLVPQTSRSKGLLKWKGIVFAPKTFSTPKVDKKSRNSSEPSNVEEHQNEQENNTPDQILMVELNRGWNSRLGFSLQGNGCCTYISAVYAESVAARDGRLQPGDILLMVNDEDVQNMNASDVIDLLRKTRGTISITVLRKSDRNKD